ncbi:serine hydrolase FSH protein [Rutstroemia sp. NJR-2017a BBW]|nr:serine hydrolase FSH protein [Rutstroemia sp. NJR-2017a BBW]
MSTNRQKVFTAGAPVPNPPAAIRYELGDHHTYDFVEGNVPWEVDPVPFPSNLTRLQAIKTLMPSEQEAFAYFDDNSAKSALKAYNDFITFLETDGPYDGVIAFSQAVPLVSSWMIQQVRQGKPIEATFKCAVFFSAGDLPYDLDALQSGSNAFLREKESGAVIDIPTAHVWGEADWVADTAMEFTKLCKADTRSFFVHKGGHEIPGSSAEDAVTRSVNIIRRAIQLAEVVV